MEQNVLMNEALDALECLDNIPFKMIATLGDCDAC